MKTAQLNVLVEAAVKDQVSKIAATAGVSSGVVVRAALRYGLRHVQRDVRTGRLRDE